MAGAFASFAASASVVVCIVSISFAFIVAYLFLWVLWGGSPAVWSELSDPRVVFVRSSGILRGAGCVVLIVARIKAFVRLSGGRSNGTAVGLVFSNLKEPCVNRTGPGESLTRRAVTRVPDSRALRSPFQSLSQSKKSPCHRGSNHARTPYCNVACLIRKTKRFIICQKK